MYNKKDTNLGGWFANIAAAMSTNTSGGAPSKFFSKVYSVTTPTASIATVPIAVNKQLQIAPQWKSGDPIVTVPEGNIVQRTVQPVMFGTTFASKIPGNIRTAVARQAAPERPTQPAIQSQFYGGVAPRGITKFVAGGGLFGWLRRIFTPKPELIEPVINPNIEYL